MMDMAYEAKKGPDNRDCGIPAGNAFSPAYPAENLGKRTAVADLTGAWSGTLVIFGQRVDFAFHVTDTADGLTASFDCPQAKLFAMPVRRTTFCRHVVRFELGDFDADFAGVLDTETQRISGAFTQGAYQFPADLCRWVCPAQ